ncbi:MFS transporter (Seo1) [Colletotrichum fioriniae]|uniref:MFS transporter (Seo1) n=1 Tax=Colletotrichum fioriniae TaxID=710243 RepID=UPI0032DBB1E5|nr:MFS transporter (Seo1) [Colletotrichum fioriniae]
MSSALKESVPRDKWWEWRWFSPDDTKEERRLITKIDLLLVPYSVLGYWVKYVDQSNLNNAYVAGMKEDLGFYGNELVQLQTLFTLGSVLGQIPFFIVDFGLGSWYRGHEIARRGGIFYTGLAAGTLTAGLIQAGASSSLEGVHGMEGWRWMYIIYALITIPVGIFGFFVIPGTIDQPNRWCVNDKDIETARERLEKHGHVLHGKMKFGHIKRTLLGFRFWLVITTDVLFWNAGIHKNTGSYLLWIKSLGRYSAARINELGTISPALGIAYTLIACFASDMFLGPAWSITICSVLNAIGLIFLTIWTVPEGGLWFGFATMYWSNALSSVFHGWVNNLLRDSPEERSFTLVLINLLSQSSTAWTPLLTFPTVESPRYRKGFSFCLGCAIALIMFTWIMHYYLKRDKKHDTGSTDEETSTQSEVGEASSVELKAKSNSDAKEDDQVAVSVNKETGDDRITAI